ncbi:hypothetical protein M758_UG083700 [Ceratodon purpureus]|nr:hypothetical protein M758_UG083700 [Ceratodon purpureus]
MRPSMTIRKSVESHSDVPLNSSIWRNIMHSRGWFVAKAVSISSTLLLRGDVCSCVASFSGPEDVRPSFWTSLLRNKASSERVELGVFGLKHPEDAPSPTGGSIPVSGFDLQGLDFPCNLCRE